MAAGMDIQPNRGRSRRWTDDFVKHYGLFQTKRVGGLRTTQPCHQDHVAKLGAAEAHYARLLRQNFRRRPNSATGHADGVEKANGAD